MDVAESQAVHSSNDTALLLWQPSCGPCPLSYRALCQRYHSPSDTGLSSGKTDPKSRLGLHLPFQTLTPPGTIYLSSHDQTPNLCCLRSTRIQLTPSHLSNGKSVLESSCIVCQDRLNHCLSFPGTRYRCPLSDLSPRCQLVTNCRPDTSQAPCLILGRF